MRKLLYILLLLSASCAHVTSPTGGPKDETPPTKLLSAPAHEAKNFKGQTITLTFDEWIKLKDPKEEIIITPEIKSPSFTVKKNKLEISWEQKLLDSTTYTIAFREGVQDLTEGNPAENLSLAFSTGPIIDTLKISGLVKDALTDKPLEKFTVGIYSADTFNILKHKPTFFSKTSKTGKFTIPNLKQGRYYIYAFQDKSKNLLLDSKSEAFGFLTEPFELSENKDSLQIITYKVDSRPLQLSSIRQLGYFTKVRLNKPVENFKLIQLNNAGNKVHAAFSETQSEIDLFPTTPPSDSILVKLTSQDSLSNTLDTTFYIKQTTARSLKEKIKINITETTLASELQVLTSTIQLSHLPGSITSDSIYILQDSTKKMTVDKSAIFLDTIKRLIHIKKSFNPSDSIKWKQTKLHFAPSAFISILGDSSVHTETAIKLSNPEELAVLNLELKDYPPSSLIQLLNEKHEIIQQKAASPKLSFKNINPISVQLRLVVDKNNNNKWDSGNPNQRTQPEEIRYYRNKEGKTTTPLRANWEVNILWNTK